jgi:hypothetical protein
MPFQLTASEGSSPRSGWSVNGKGKNGELTPHEMATFLHGQAVTKFELVADRYQNYMAYITFAKGDELELYNGPNDRCRMIFRKLVKPK